MKFVVISDTHCRHHNLNLPKGDVLLHAGDISYKGKRTEAVDFIAWMDKQPFQYKIFIAGNHDFYFEQENMVAIQQFLPPNVIYLCDSGVEVGGIKIWGSPYTPWFFNWAFNTPRGASINKHWKLIPQDTDVLITHGPPLGILDTVINGRHVGCKDLLKKVQEIKPKFHVFGHVHEAYGKIKRGETQFYNSCILNEQYELSNLPFTFEL